jgi:WD40 repeat protein
VKIWDVSTGIEVQTLIGHTDIVDRVTFSPNGNQLASGSSDGTVRLWDTSPGGAVHRPATDAVPFTCLAFSPSGQQFVTGSRNGTVWIWDSHTGVPIGSPLLHSVRIRSVYYHEWPGALLLVVHHSEYYDDPSPDSTVWNMSATPPSLFSTCHLPVRPAPSPSLFKINDWINWTSIPTAGISFYLPSSFVFYSDVCSLHGGRIAYGGRDGTVIIIDLSHLLPNSSMN